MSDKIKMVSALPEGPKVRVMTPTSGCRQQGDGQITICGIGSWG